MTRAEIEALKPGIEMNLLVAKEVENSKAFEVSDEDGTAAGFRMVKDRRYQDLPDYSRDMTTALTLMDSPGFGIGLFISPLNSGKWVCGKANHIYDIEITDDHYRDKELVIADTAPEAICKMRLVMALCLEEAVNHVS